MSTVAVHHDADDAVRVRTGDRPAGRLCELIHRNPSQLGVRPPTTERPAAPATVLRVGVRLDGRPPP